MSKDMGKRLPQLYYIKTKISYDRGFIAIGVANATQWRHYFFNLSLCFSVPGVFWRNSLREYVPAISDSILAKFAQILWERFRIFWNAVLTIVKAWNMCEISQDEKSSIHKLKHGGNTWLRGGNTATNACFRCRIHCGFSCFRRCVYNGAGTLF